MLQNYWPEASNVNDCIKNEAETADVAVLLATHQPLTFIARNAGSNIETQKSEQDLLDAFISDNVPEGFLLFPITGPSGVGKSHVIRWLDAQLRRSAKKELLHIIRIPKSASLRKVVELILEPLAGDPEYESSRSDFTKAVSQVDKNAAVVRFRAEIENALNRLSAEMISEAKENKSLLSSIGHAQRLPKLFSDAALSEHFDKNVLSRVIARALYGRDEETEKQFASSETASQFFADDFILPDNVNLNQASSLVQNYYHTSLSSRDGSAREAAAVLLNGIVNNAISNVFQLEQSTSGVTLQDIISNVRKLLFKNGKKELVLLVEDFAALSGIQETLLKVCIQQGVDGGEQARATMRTALAVTDGYLAGRDTYLTRAQRVWVISGSHQNEQKLMDATVDMVGSYLNAARWGKRELQKQFARQASGEGLTDWLISWEDGQVTDDDNEVLKAFGFSRRGHALFPFNRLGIEQLAKLHLNDGGDLIFNPRKIINHVLREPLFLRSSFAASTFPPANFQELRPNAYLARLVDEARLPPEVRERLNSTLTIWAGNAPDEAALSQVPPLIFKTFSLPTPEELANIGYTPVDETNDPVDTPNHLKPAPIPPPVPGSKDDTKVSNWSAKLEDWVGGKKLEQSDARELRNALRLLLKDSINWPALRIPAQEINAQWLTIANAQGNLAAGRRLIVCDSHEDKDASLREGFLGALRFSYNGGSWNYPEAHNDYVASSIIIDRLVSQLTPILIEEANEQISVLGQTLINQSRVLGLATPLRSTDPEAVVRAILTDPAQKEPEPFEEAWDQLLVRASAPELRQQLQECLLERIACYQGTGTTPHALDVSRLLGALTSAPSDFRSPDQWPGPVREFIPLMGDVRLSRQLQKPIQKLRIFREEIAAYIDSTFDKDAFVEDLRTIIPMLQRLQSWPTNLADKPSEFQARLTLFQKSAFIGLVEKIAIIADDSGKDNLPKLLNALGSMDLGMVDRTMSFLRIAEDLISKAEAKVEQQLIMRGGSNPQQNVADLIALLEEVSGTSASKKEASE